MFTFCSYSGNQGILNPFVLKSFVLKITVLVYLFCFFSFVFSLISIYIHTLTHFFCLNEITMKTTERKQIFTEIIRINGFRINEFRSPRSLCYQHFPSYYYSLLAKWSIRTDLGSSNNIWPLHSRLAKL